MFAPVNQVLYIQKLGVKGCNLHGCVILMVDQQGIILDVTIFRIQWNDSNQCDEDHHMTLHGLISAYICLYD